MHLLPCTDNGDCSDGITTTVISPFIIVFLTNVILTVTLPDDSKPVNTGLSKYTLIISVNRHHLFVYVLASNMLIIIIMNMYASSTNN